MANASPAGKISTFADWVSTLRTPNVSTALENAHKKSAHFWLEVGMNEKFKLLIESLEPSYQRLMRMAPVNVGTIPFDVPRSGIYLLSEGGNYLYVGRSNRIKQRLQEHCRPSSNHNTAPFAFRLAREATGKLKASYTENESRTHLETQPEFKNEFIKAKERIRNMSIRFVGEPDPLRQALLEMYVSICLATPHNDFDNH